MILHNSLGDITPSEYEMPSLVFLTPGRPTVSNPSVRLKHFQQKPPVALTLCPYSLADIAKTPTELQPLSPALSQPPISLRPPSTFRDRSIRRHTPRRTSMTRLLRRHCPRGSPGATPVATPLGNGLQLIACRRQTRERGETRRRQRDSNRCRGSSGRAVARRVCS